MRLAVLVTGAFRTICDCEPNVARGCRYPRSVLSARAVLVAISAVVCVLLLGGAGCGGSSSSSAGGGSGARLFGEAGCGDCHALTAAGTRARTGPDLDALAPSFATIAEQVRDGGGGMPAFADVLTEDEIVELATFVSSATGGAQAADAATAAAFEPDDTRLESCAGRFACVEQAFGNLAFEQGAKAALAAFDREIARDAEIERNCHRIAHAIGAAALLRYDGRVGKAFADGSASCWSGYYHGILERAFSDVEADELGPVSRELCSDGDVRRTAFLAYQCVHGLGHGLMLFTNYDLPQSLAVCDELATSWDQTSCTGGVFMENISSSYGITSKWLRDDDPIYPCQTVAERHKLYCYLMVTSRILPLVGGDFARAAQECRRSEARWVATCFQSLGRDASGTTRGDIGEMLRICAGSGDMAPECVYGAARDLTSNDGGARRSRSLCAAAPSTHRDYCYEGVGTILGGLFADRAEVRASCEGVSSERRARTACLRGAGLS
jgi:mono/diheme cytochrome c family protein